MPSVHARRIILWKPNPTASSDAGGVEVTDVKSAPKQYFQKGPYASHDQRPPHSTTGGVPSLQLICLTKARELLELREDWREVLTDVMPAWRAHTTTYESVVKSRSIQHLLPGVDSNPSSVTPLKRVDPLTWALIIQLVRDLPSRYRRYEITLSDIHLPLLQHIPDSNEFCLITVLNLQGCLHLTDDTIFHLKDLHGLVALNASGCTGLSTTAITRLRNGLVRDKHDTENVTRRGPWRLRMLWLRGCRSLNSSIFAELEKFPLLSVVDLTGTACYYRGNTAFQAATAAQLKLYHPAQLIDATHALTSAKGVLPSHNVFYLYIDELHPETNRLNKPHRPTVKEEDGFVVLSKNTLRHGRLPPESTTERKPLTHDDDRTPAHFPFQSLYEDGDGDDVLNYVSNPDERAEGWERGSSRSPAESDDESSDEPIPGYNPLDARRFYGTSLPQSDSDALFLRKMAAFAPLEDAPTTAEPRLNPLMLYRKPPPYVTLFKPPLHRAPTTMPPSDFIVSAAPANRTVPHVNAALESLGKLNKQLARKQVAATVRPADGFGIPNTSDSKTPRNPFLARSRRPDFGTTSASSSSSSSPRVASSDIFTTTDPIVGDAKRLRRRTSHSAIVDSTALPALTPPSLNHGSRPLRGISALAVPSPPPTTKKRPRTSSKLAPAKKTKTTTLDPALMAPPPQSKGLRPMTSASLRQKMEQQKKAEEDKEEMLVSEKKERRKSTGSVKASSSSSRPRDRTSTAGGRLDNWFTRS